MPLQESHAVEYKQTWSDDCLKVVSAMANASGGTLFIGMDDRGNPVALKNTKKLDLNERQIKAVLYVKENGKITNTEYQKFGMKKRQATDDLKELEAKGILEKVGTTGRGTYYILRGTKRAKGASNGR